MEEVIYARMWSKSSTVIVSVNNKMHSEKAFTIPEFLVVNDLQHIADYSNDTITFTTGMNKIAARAH
jgi:hypothetical protein